MHLLPIHMNAKLVAECPMRMHGYRLNFTMVPFRELVEEQRGLVN